MTEARRNLMVGLFVFVGLALLGTLIILFGKGPTWLSTRGSYVLHINFKEAAGIREGNIVTVRGVEVGRVSHVGLIDEANFEAGVDVQVAVQRKYRITAGSRAVAQQPVLGQGRPPIAIIPGPPDAPQLASGAAINGEVRSAIDAIFPPEIVSTFDKSATQIGEAAEALTPVLQDVHELMRPRTPTEVDVTGGPPGNLSSAMTRLDSSIRHFNEVLGDPAVKSQLRETIANMRDISADGKAAIGDLRVASSDAKQVVADARQFTTKANESLTKLDADVDRIAARTMDGLDKATQFLDYLNVAGRQIANGEGTIGLLVKDSRLYEAMVLTAERLARAVDDFRSLIAEWQKGKIRVGL